MDEDPTKWWNLEVKNDEIPEESGIFVDEATREAKLKELNRLEEFAEYEVVPVEQAAGKHWVRTRCRRSLRTIRGKRVKEGAVHG